LEWISKSSLKSGRITIKDIARRLEISPATVSRVLRDHPDISSEIKKSVFYPLMMSTMTVPLKPCGPVPLVSNRIAGLIVSISQTTQNFDHFQVLKRREIPIVFLIVFVKNWMPVKLLSMIKKGYLTLLNI